MSSAPTFPGKSQDVLINKWTINGNTISLFHLPETGLLAFADGRTGKVTKFRSSLYDVNYAISLVTLFHKTIEENLKQDATNSACFLPKLCMAAQNAPEFKVALFGRVDIQTDPRGILKGMRWGVFHLPTKVEHTFEINQEQIITTTFLREAPSTNLPHLVEVGRDDDHRPIMEPAEDHYAMTAYAKHFAVSLIEDPTSQPKRIQGVALNRVSLLNRNVIVNEEKWAVTLVSALQSTRGFFSGLFNSNVGHAMLACEGVIGGKQFLRYIHFTQNPRNNNPNRQNDEGQIESFERKTPLNSQNGPTLPRPRNAVENMLTYAQEMETKPLKFSLYKGFFSGPNTWWLSFKMEILEMNRHQLWEEALSTDTSNFPRTCLDCAYSIANKAGIIFQGNRPFTTPLEKMEIIATAPIYQIPNGFNHELLGRSFPQTQHVISKQILSACIVLTPDDCSPNNFSKWAFQTFVEETAATDREIVRLQSCRSFAEMKANAWFPKKW